MLNLCHWIGQKEKADLEILSAAAILHDVVNLPKNHPERLTASKKAAEKSKDLLATAGFTSGEIAAITCVIEEHSYSLGKKPSSIESAVLQDSDKLDAMGAIGIMRAVTCGSRMGASFYNVQDPFSQNRTLDDKKYTVDHFYTKLLKLSELMNTATAKAEAQRRTQFMELFLDNLKIEMNRPE